MIESSTGKERQLDIGSGNHLSCRADRSVTAGDEDSLRPSRDRTLDLRLQLRWLDFVEIKTARRRQRVSGRFDLHEVEPSKRSEEHTSELQSHSDLVCRLLP